MADDQKRALLAAVAQQGTAGADAYKQYADSVAAQRAAAVSAAQQRSSVINAGPAATADLTGDATATSDPYAKDAATGAQAYANENARMSQANGDYMDQVKAAIPLVQQRAAEAAASRKAAAAPKDAGNPFADLIASLGGNDLAKAQLPAMLNDVISESTKNSYTWPTNRSRYAPIGDYLKQWKDSLNAAAATQTPEAKTATIDKAAQSIGIPAGVLQRFLGKDSPDYVTPEKPPTAAAKNKATLDDLRNSPEYQSEFGNMTQAYQAFTDKKGKYKLSATAAKQRIAQTARSQPAYSSNQDAVEQALRDLK